MAARPARALQGACWCLRTARHRPFATEAELPPGHDLDGPIASTSQAGAKWKPALKPGTFPLYDLALEYIQQDQMEQLARVDELRAKAKSREEHEEADRAEARALVNDPESRWIFQHGEPDYSKPIYRHLRQERWRRQGDLAYTMRAVQEDKLIPDLFATIEPTVELNVRFDDPASDTHGEVPSKLIYPSKTLKPPHIRAFVPHSDEQLYTIALVDPDAPDEERVSYREKWHWLKVNVPLSPTKRDPADESSGSTILPWHPPHPEQGTDVHRYTLVLMKQDGPLDLSSETVPRHGPLLLRSWLTRYDAKLAGVFHWICSNRGPKYGPIAATVSHIYKDILKQREPIYTKSYKIDKYRLYGAVGRSKGDI